MSRAAYLVGLVLVLVPMFSLATGEPFRPGPTWRIQEFSTLSGGLSPAMLGVAIMLFTARALRSGRMQLVLGALALTGAVFVVALLGVFILDALEVMAQLPADAKPQFLRLVARASLQSTAVTGALAALGVVGVAGARRQRADDRAGETTVNAPVFVRSRAPTGSEG